MVSGPLTLEALFAEHLDFVLRSLLRLGVSPRDVEDAAQQVLWIAHQGLAQIDPARPRAWLWGVARRVASDHRALARHRVELDGGAAQDRQVSPENVLERLSARELVHRALEALPLERREVLILYEMEGMTLAEIAELSSAPLQTVAGRLRKARAEFADAVAQLEGGGR